MYHKKIALLFFVLPMLCTQLSFCAIPSNYSKRKDIDMTDQLLVVKADCRQNERCLFDGEDMFLDISITNKQTAAIGFPLEYAKTTGPIIKLIDTESKVETFLRPNIADWDLKEKFTTIQPGQSVNIEWVITSGELRQFNHHHVDLFAEITIMADVLMNGKVLNFKGSDTVRIVDKEKADDSSQN